MDTFTVNPLLIPLGGLFISNLFEGGLIETGGLIGRRGGLIYFRKNNGISCPQRTRTQRGEAQEQMVGVHAAEDQNQIQISSW